MQNITFKKNFLLYSNKTYLISVILILFSCKDTFLIKKSASNVPAYAPKKGKYNPSRDIDFSLIHTKLELSFDFKDKKLLGKATLWLKPHFYPQDTLKIDAKEFDIQTIEIREPEFFEIKNYIYDNKIITIPLPQRLKRDDTLKIWIDYIANPERQPRKGNATIMENKGIYFINTDNKDINKPFQVWTQSETESASCWFPTLDSPNQKTTQEMFITVPDEYITLSNGILVYSLSNNDGTRTDCWKQSLPHAPYLFMLAIGKYSKSCDWWKDKEICYYVEPEYHPYAKQIFGLTPEMIDFFSKKLNYDFPWEKYSQITVRDFVSGAMENTSASVFMEALQMNSRELRDKSWESIIAHELFHQWFGNLVTCESWANLPLNESFANYSEYLWLEHKHGKDEADYHLYEELLDYLKESETKQEPLIRYYYVDKDDMFDAHSYSKGGCILHLLRNTIGEEAFFAALNLYLTQNKFKAAEIHHFRLAVEEITGKDMNWFFDQYFLKPGHVKLIAEHQYRSGILKINLLQAQDTSFTPIFKMNLKITIYTKDGKIEKEVFMDKDYISINIPLQEPPLNVIIDSDQTLVGTLQHEKKID